MGILCGFTGINGIGIANMGLVVSNRLNFGYASKEINIAYHSFV